MRAVRFCGCGGCSLPARPAEADRPPVWIVAACGPVSTPPRAIGPAPAGAERVIPCRAWLWPGKPCGVKGRAEDADIVVFMGRDAAPDNPDSNRRGWVEPIPDPG